MAFPLTDLTHVTKWARACDDHLNDVWNNPSTRTSSHLCDAIDHLLSFTTPQFGELETIHVANQWLAAHLKDLLQMIMTEDQQNERQRHPLGLVRIVLLASKRFTCRIHSRKTSGEFKEDIHNHKCHFSTVMIKGGYTHEIYQVEFDDEYLRQFNSVGANDMSNNSSQTYPCYRFKKVEQAYEQENAGTARAAKIQSSNLKNNNNYNCAYALPSHLYHCLTSLSPSLITLTVRGTPTNQDNCMFLRDTPISTVREPGTNAMKMEQLDQLETDLIFKEIPSILS
ncbi:unnamed protein product [Didymodactylos carnosus]|uniref:Uncharacterized protein n=1 Tax=Didymodactylos carnosus TaxID=1234261 RepID=A0A815WJX8_9BILA|nr:unnamed protein product [Didymodactylos carnosus]CAF1548727.1 unnamed protein product [Didymodactylos carnosus]CAF4229626.1 unnamed protein product [Didymodactylos carnosus]CAF4409640.1 unnamed protein product [Didymodactylos carnosus]